MWNIFLSLTPLAETKIYKHLGCLLENHSATKELTLKCPLQIPTPFLGEKYYVAVYRQAFPLSFIHSLLSLLLETHLHLKEWGLSTFKVSGTFQDFSLIPQPGFPVVFWLLLLWGSRTLCLL